MMRIFFLALAFACLWRLGAVQAVAGDVSASYVYPGDEGNSDVAQRNQYYWRVLRAALDHTRAGWGDYRLEATVPMMEKRRMRALESHEGGMNVSIFPPQRSLANRFLSVPIPIDRGLLGYRVLLIRQTDQPRFDAVGSAAALNGVRFGLMGWWEDVAVMRNAGLMVVEGTSYEGLFKMLEAGRFEAFSRGVGEVLQEFEMRRKDLPGVAIEKHLLLHYPMGMYFWFTDNEDGRHRAERVREGLLNMIEDGSFQALFDEEFGSLLKTLDLGRRTVIELSNPLLDDDFMPDDAGVLYHVPEN